MESGGREGLGSETTDRGRVASRPGGGFAGCLLRAVLEESVPQEVPGGRAAADQLVQAVVVLLVAGKLSVACFPHMLQAQVAASLLDGSGGFIDSLKLYLAPLSPLAAFTSGAYFLHNERRWQQICKVYSASFKGISEGL